jgi:serine/threonine-protein kinase
VEVPFRRGRLLGGRFTLERQLGSGGTGTVWLAQDRETGGPVALKFLHSFQLDLDREAEALARLDHPNIARLVLHGLEQELVYLAIEYVEGISLDLIIGSHAERGEHLAIGTVSRLFEGVCHAVIYAHLQGVVHRDLKPHHVLVRGASSVKVIDFGTAKLVDQRPERASTVGRIYGSPSYMSPEQVSGDGATERSDVFALGTILFEMLTLKRAWLWEGDRPMSAFVEQSPEVRAQNHPVAVMGRIASAPRPKPSVHRPSLLSLDPILAAAMAIDPNARQPSVADLLEDVLPLLTEVEERIGEAPTERIDPEETLPSS